MTTWTNRMIRKKSLILPVILPLQNFTNTDGMEGMILIHDGKTLERLIP